MDTALVSRGLPGQVSAPCTEPPPLIASHPLDALCRVEEPIEEQEPGCVCPFIYQPVCGTFADGTTQTFDNACMAGCEKLESVVEGKW